MHRAATWRLRALGVAAFWFAAMASPVAGANWPMFGYDPARSGVDGSAPVLIVTRRTRANQNAVGTAARIAKPSRDERGAAMRFTSANRVRTAAGGTLAIALAGAHGGHFSAGTVFDIAP